MNVDTHIHSSYSREGDPERCNPRLILRVARKAGLDGICISDHDTMEGYHEARRIRKPRDPLLIPACEVSTSRGHLLVLGVEGRWDKGVDPHEVVDAVRSEGGVVSAPHPFYLSTISVSWLARDLGLAVEAFNAMASILLYPNLIARKFAIKYGLPMTAGSDAHSYEIIGLGRTVTEGETIDDFISDVDRGRAGIEGRNPSFRFALKFAAESVTGVISKILSDH